MSTADTIDDRNPQRVSQCRIITLTTFEGDVETQQALRDEDAAAPGELQTGSLGLLERPPYLTRRYRDFFNTTPAFSSYGAVEPGSLTYRKYKNRFHLAQGMLRVAFDPMGTWSIGEKNAKRMPSNPSKSSCQRQGLEKFF
ncbi:MAG: hypothetical protein WB762_31765 [Candidatus Sulfotelmatobacter sp.]